MEHAYFPEWYLCPEMNDLQATGTIYLKTLKNCIIEHFNDESKHKKLLLGEEQEAVDHIIKAGEAALIRSYFLQSLIAYLTNNSKSFFNIGGAEANSCIGLLQTLQKISTSYRSNWVFAKLLGVIELVSLDMQLSYTVLVHEFNGAFEFHRKLGMFFHSTLAARHAAWQEKTNAEKSCLTDDYESEDEEEDGFELFQDYELIQGVEEYEDEILKHIKLLGWASFFRDEITHALYDAVECFINSSCKGNYKGNPLSQVMIWQQEVLDPWLVSILSDDSGELKRLEEWRCRLNFCIHEIFCSVRISKLFDIIMSYEDSIPEVTHTIEVLASSLKITQLQRSLVKGLKKQFTERLLHPGANTNNIIEAYIYTIRVLRILDPSDTLLDEIAGPIRKYLKRRKDTIRCIVNSLTDEKDGFLAHELRNAIPLDDAQYDSDDDDDGDPNWMPAPREVIGSAQLKRQLSVRPGADILSILISIYGSKELFVEEYRLILAKKLLDNMDYNTDNETTILELLKLKFGDSSMHQCEIMIKDLQHSKHINNIVQDKLKQVGREAEAADIDAVIVSQHFWPPLQGGSGEMVLHKDIQKQASTFSEIFSILKAQKSVEWKNQLGTVDIDLEFDGGKVRSFNVYPLHANLILHFQDKTQWSLSELADAVGLASSTIYDKLVYWVNQGVLKELSGQGNMDGAGVFEIIEAQDNQSSQTKYENNSRGLAEEVVSLAAQKEEQKIRIEEYVIGLLKSRGSASLSEIHNHLKVFASSDDGKKYNQTFEELANLLSSSNKIEECMDGVFQILKKEEENKNESIDH